MTVAQLFARIGLKADTKDAEKLSKSLNGIVKEFKVAALGSASFVAGVAIAMNGALRTAAAFRQFQAETGASSEELQKWQAIASGTNVSTQAIADSVKELAQNREKIKLGGGNMSGFAFLGINPMDDPFKILDQLRTKTQGLPQAMKANLLGQMGVSSEFLQILNLTNDEFDRMRSNAFVIPQSALTSLNQTQGNLNTLGNAVKWLQALMAERLAPVIDRVVKNVTEWVKVNKDGLITGILNGTRLLVKFFEAVYNVVSWIVKVISGTIGWKNALNVFLVALAYFNRALLMSPIGLLVGGILLLVAVLDDLHAAFGVDGDKRESFFGSIFKKFPEVKKSFEETFGFLKDFSEVIKGLFGGDQKAFDAVIKKWGDFGTALKTIKEYVQWLIENFGKAFGSAGKDLGTIDKLLKGDSKPAQDAIKEWLDTNFGQGLYGVLGPQLSALFGVKPEMAGASAGAGAGGGGGSVSVEVKNTSSAPITSQVEVKRGNTEAKTIQTNRGGGYY